MNRIISALLLAASAVAQEPKREAAPAPDMVRKVVDVKHLSGERADRAVQLITTYLQNSGAIRFDPILKTAVILGPEKLVSGAEALLAKFDSPSGVKPDRQIQLRIHLIEASRDGAGGTIPTEVAPAVEQMKKNFAYKGYRLIDTLTVVGKDGFTAAGSLPAERETPTTYNLRVQSSNVLDDAKTVALKNFSFAMRVPRIDAAGKVQGFTDTSVQTDLSIQESQKLVVGKLASEKAQGAIFLVLTVDVL
jgi:hypothetical protein